MKFVIETKALQAALAIVGVVSPGRSPLPMLGNVKIQAREDDLLTLSVTDLSLFVDHAVAAKVAKPGSVTIPFALFSRLVARITSSRITVALTGATVEFASGDIKASFDTLPVDEFPAAPERTGEWIPCDGQDILDPFSALEHAIASDETAYQLNGISLEPCEPDDHGGMEFVATDRRRLAAFLGKKLTHRKAIVSDAFARAALKVIPKGAAFVHTGEGFITIKTDSTVLSGRLIEAEYPNWRAVMPTPSDNAFSCGRKPLIEAVRTCSIFADGRIPIVSLSGKGKEIEVSAVGKVTANVLGTELEGQPDVSVKVDSRYLLDSLNVLSGDDVRLQESSSQGKPWLMMDEGPLRLLVGMIGVAKP